MRFVDYQPANVVVQVDWTNRRNALQAQLLAEADTVARAKMVVDNSSLWADVKNELAKIFHYKCWYTESLQVGTDVDVDHFRPKNRVQELRSHVPPHAGYWWLAFSLENYRYSCIVANRRRRDIETDSVGGKADFFPIWDEATRVWDQHGNIEEEQPLLLDPCKASDVRLVTFKDDGEAMPREIEHEKPKLFKRADLSIKYYNLNHSDFVRARIVLRDDIEKLVKDAKRFYNKLESGDVHHEHAYEQAVLRLRAMISKQAPFSSFCLTYLEKYKHDDALDGILY